MVDRTRGIARSGSGATILAAIALLLAACGGSTSGSPAGGANAAITVSAADVPGLGTVLVNGSGRTLYVLSSERGGRLTCTDANGCTAVWPDTELPAGVQNGTAGPGAQASLLGTLRSADGKLYLTYGGWPLYTFAHDSGPRQGHGEGITSFGGTWWALSPSGSPVTAAQPGTPTPAGNY